MSITAVKTLATAVGDQTRCINLKDAAAMFSVHEQTFRRWAAAGIVPPGVKIGGRRLWKAYELEQHITAAK